MVLDRGVEGVDLGRSFRCRLQRLVRRGLRRGDWSAPVDGRTTHTLGGRSGRRRLTREGHGGSSSANRRRLGGSLGSSLAALFLVDDRRGIGFRNDVDDAVAVRVHQTKAGRGVELAADRVGGAVGTSRFARHDVLEKPKLRRRLGRDRAAEPLCVTCHVIRTTRDIQRLPIATGAFPGVDLAVVVDLVVPELGRSGVDLCMLVVAVAALGAGSQDARGRADRVLVFVHIGALCHLRERIHGNERGRENHQQGEIALHEALHRALSPEIGNTAVPSGCEVEERPQQHVSRHPEGLDA